MLLLQSIQQQLLGKVLSNKLSVSSTTDTLLKNQTFVAGFLTEDYEHPFLRKEQFIALFVKSFKTATILRTPFTFKETAPLVFNEGDLDLKVMFKSLEKNFSVYNKYLRLIRYQISTLHEKNLLFSTVFSNNFSAFVLAIVQFMSATAFPLLQSDMISHFL